MVAANENDRPKELSASFRVVLTEDPAKMMPFLEMESSPEPSTALQDTGLSKENVSFRSTSTSTSGRVVSPDDPEPKSVRFAPPEEGGVVVHHDDIVPAVTEEERSRMYYSKDEKKNMKLSMKHAVMYFRSGSNSLFLPPTSTSTPIMARMVFSPSTDSAVVVGDEERTRIGLETSILPQIKLHSRRKMARLVAKHRGWEHQHPAFFGEEFLAQNCRAISSSSRELAIERARAVVDELERDATATTSEDERRGASCCEPTEGATAGAATSARTTGATSATDGEGQGAVDDSCSEAAMVKNDPVEPFFCSVETIFDASTGDTNLSVPSTDATTCTATITVETIRMEAPSNTCMVR